MLKKTVVFLLVLTMVSSVAAFAMFSDVESDGEYATAIERLVEYGILSGKGDGLFDPSAGLTRAEMAKISTVVAGLESQAASSMGTSMYSDMDGSYWASGYVNVAAKNMLILGYPDGTYAPEKSLTFAEAVTVVLRLLGYSAEDLGDNWPFAYTAKARELSLTAGIEQGDYDIICRADIALIIDRALLTDMDKSDAEGKSEKLIQRMGYSITDECIILATNAENKNLLSDEVSTTAGVFKKLNDSVDKYVTRKVRLVLNNESRVVGGVPVNQTGKDIIIQSVVGTEIAYKEGDAYSSLKLDNTSAVYYQGEKKTLADVRDKIETGMTMAVYNSASGAYDYAVIKDFDMKGPVVVTERLTGGETSISGMTINVNGIRVIRDGYEAKLSDIQAFDVVYYNAVSNIVYAYCDKVSGVYEKAYPNKAGVTKITVSGVEYELETQSAVKMLGEYPGAYKINDFLTLLIGRDGKVVSAVSANATDLTSYGIILSCEERVSTDEKTKGTKENYIKVFTVSGVEQEFKTDKDYSEYRGRLIEYQVEGGIMVPQFVAGRKIAGKLDAERRMIGNYWISEDAKIIDLSYVPTSYGSGGAKASLIRLSDITFSSLTEENVIHAQLDSTFGDIQFIVLNNVTMQRYQFGIITDKSGASYDIDVKGEVKNYRTNVHYLTKGQPVMASIQDGAVTEIKPLIELSVSGAYAASDLQRIKVGTASYKLAVDAVAYLYKDFKYMSVSLNELPSHNVKSVRLFADKAVANGGVVRIIVFTE